jgi:hypothetical protein
MLSPVASTGLDGSGPAAGADSITSSDIGRGIVLQTSRPSASARREKSEFDPTLYSE